MALPDATTLLDDFNRADGAVIAGAGATIWAATNVAGAAQAMTIVSNELVPSGASTNGGRSLQAFGPDIDFSVKLTAKTTTNGGYLAFYYGAHNIGASFSSRAILINVGVGGNLTFNWRRFVAGAGANWASGTFTTQPVAGDRFAVTVRGQSETFWHFIAATGVWDNRGTQVNTVTPIASGYIGFENSDAVSKFDDVFVDTVMPLVPSFGSQRYGPRQGFQRFQETRWIPEVSTGPVTADLSGTAAGVGDVTAQLTAPAGMSGTAAGSGAVTANLTAASQMTGTAAGVGSVTANLTAAAKMTATAAGVGDATGRLAAGTPGTLSGLIGWYDAANLPAGALASWLDLSGAGRDVAQATGTKKPVVSTGSLNGLPTMNFDGTDDYLVSANATSPTAGVSIFAVVRPTVADANYRSVVSHATGSTWVAPFAAYHLRIDGNSPFPWAGWVEDGNDINNYAVDTAVAATNSWYVEEFIYDQSNLKLYKNGTQTATKARTGTLTSRNFPLYIGTITNLTANFQGDIAEILIYDRGLNSTERGQIETYLQNKWLPTSGASLSGTAAGVGSVTANLTAASQMAGTAAGVGSATANLTAAALMSGTAAGVGSVTANLTAAAKMTGTAAGVGAVTANLTAPSQLTATAAGVGAATGTLKTTPQLSGTATGVGSVTATLTAAALMSGTAAGVGSVTATLTATALMSGTAAGIGAVTANLTAASLMTGTAAGIGSVSALLTASSKMTGTAAGIGSVSATLTVPGAALLTGTAAGIGSVTGVLTAASKMTGTAAGIGAITGQLTASPQLTGTAAGIGSAAGTLKTTAQLSATAAGIGSAAGTLKVTAQLSGTAAGIGSVTAFLTSAVSPNAIETLVAVIAAHHTSAAIVDPAPEAVLIYGGNREAVVVDTIPSVTVATPHLDADIVGPHHLAVVEHD